MRHVTVELPPDLRARLSAEARRLGVSADRLASDRIEAYLKGRTTQRRTLAFAASARSGRGDIARSIDAELAEGWLGSGLDGRVRPEA